MTLDAKLDALAPIARQAPGFALDGERRVVLFLAFTDGEGRATVLSVAAPDAAAAWARAARRLRAEAGNPRWLRLDWVRAAERTDWRTLRDRLSRTKRNYFRLGIALDAAFEHVFLETELNANAMLYGGPRIPTAVVNEGNFTRYAARRHALGAIDFGDDTPVRLFSTHGAFVGEDGAVHRIDGQGRNAGRRTVERLDPALLGDVIHAGSAYLAGQVGADGRFAYGWHPCFDRPIPAYNSLRHASTLYAMLEAWEVTRDAALLDAIERGIGYLTETLIQPATLPGGGEAAFLTDAGDEIKLGGNAVCLLALVKYSTLMGTDRWRPLLDRLGAGILHMQDARTGRFVHVLHWPSLGVKQDFRIIYYDGEAAFGLMRLYAFTGDPRWLAAVERAFDHFIAAGHAQAHDHWLSYCANALTRHRPEERYFRFGIDNVRDHLDFVIDRITTFPTLLELMMAAEEMVSRLRADPARRHLLDDLDLPKFHRAMHARAHYLLNGHFWPELAMFFANPARIVDSFFIRHHGFRVRIDDVEHYLSGLIAYRRYLIDHPEECGPERGWSADNVARATGGAWTAPPPPGWTSTGLCIHAPTMRAGEMVAARTAIGGRGVPPAGIAALPYRPAAILAVAPESIAPESIAGADAPVLRVADIDAAVLALALAVDGPVAGTRHNANLPHGIAWNLASIPWDTAHIVLELAIGRMARNARLARPDVAVFANVLPAHLEHHRDLATVARRKSAIFSGMAPGALAIVNRDMAHHGDVRARALDAGLDILTYGLAPDADYRLLRHGAGEVVALTPRGALSFPLAAPGAHMAVNSLAVLALLDRLALRERGLAALAGFTPLDGRGAETVLTIDGRRITLIDDAYNANPGSMEAAFRLLGAREGRRVAVLGEMLELGPDSPAHHVALASLAESCGIDQLHAIGPCYDAFWNALPVKRRGIHAPTPEALWEKLPGTLLEGDTLLAKGSHGSRIHALVDRLKRS